MKIKNELNSSSITTNLLCKELIVHDIASGQTSTVNASEILKEGHYLSDFHYKIEVDKTLPFGNGPWIPAEFNIQDTGKMFQIRITDPNTGNKCWSNVKIVESISLEMVHVKGGKFKKNGSFAINDFYISKYEVSQAQWSMIMGNNPSHFTGCDSCPVENVNREEVETFIKKLNQRTGKEYRLPTGLEWRFACTGGTKSKDFRYAGSNFLDDVAWWKDNSESKTHPIGLKKPNELGLYDMNGNVWEMTYDDASGNFRTNRGGSWYDGAKEIFYEGSSVNWNTTRRSFDVGFRLARSK